MEDLKQAALKSLEQSKQFSSEERQAIADAIVAALRMQLQDPAVIQEMTGLIDRKISELLRKLDR